MSSKIVKEVFGAVQFVSYSSITISTSVEVLTVVSIAIVIVLIVRIGFRIIAFTLIAPVVEMYIASIPTTVVEGVEILCRSRSNVLVTHLVCQSFLLPLITVCSYLGIDQLLLKFFLILKRNPVVSFKTVEFPLPFIRFARFVVCYPCHFFDLRSLSGKGFRTIPKAPASSFHGKELAIRGATSDHLPTPILSNIGRVA